MPLHQQSIAYLKMTSKLGIRPVSTVTPEEARADLRTRKEGLDLIEEPVGTVMQREIEGPNRNTIKLRIYVPSGPKEKGYPLVMLFHGGGWLMGDLETEDTTGRGICSRVPAVVVSVDYRLAPESAFPAAAEDCYAAYLWAVENAAEFGADGSKTALTGTSAGGNLAGAIALMAIDRDGPPVSHVGMFCPVIEKDFTTSSYVEFAEGFGLTRDAMKWFWECYCRKVSDGAHPYVALMNAGNLSEMPDTTVITAGCDPLRDEGEKFGEKLKSEGVNAKVSRYDGMIHGFNVQAGFIDAAFEALDEMAGRFKGSLLPNTGEVS